MQPILKGEIIYVNSTTYLSSQINYSCGTGYKLVGNKMRSCQDDGRWSGTKPKCEGACIQLCPPFRRSYFPTFVSLQRLDVCLQKSPKTHQLYTMATIVLSATHSKWDQLFSTDVHRDTSCKANRCAPVKLPATGAKPHRSVFVSAALNTNHIERGN